MWLIDSDNRLCPQSSIEHKLDPVRQWRMSVMWFDDGIPTVEATRLKNPDVRLCTFSLRTDKDKHVIWIYFKEKVPMYDPKRLTVNGTYSSTR